MMIKLTRTIKLLLIIVLILFIIGCGGSSDGKSVQYNFKQGTAELQARFLPNTPPSKIFPESDFKMILELDNQAAYDAAGGEVRLVGVDDAYFNIFPLEESFDLLEGRSSINPSGSKIFLEFTGSAGMLFKNAERYQGNYQLNVNYNSKMEFADTVCINSNLYQVHDAGCQIQGSKSYSGQGGPLAITKLEEIVSPGISATAEFRISLGNRGRGTVKDVFLGASQLGGKNIACEFQGTGEDKRKITFKKDNQKAILVCKTPLEEQKSYTTTLALDFSYSYELEQKNSLQIVNPARN